MADIVVTAARTWTDIDAFACIIAYTELLTLEGKNTEAVNPVALNASVPTSFAKLGIFQTKPSDGYRKVVLVDISDPEYIAAFVKSEEVSEVYDHHDGFESYWEKRIGADAHIELIGACATLIWEEFVKREARAKISHNSATLLAAAILSNTLNFKASMTSERDRSAYEELAEAAKLPSSFAADYFRSCEAETLKDIGEALKNDTKIQELTNLDVTLAISQCELWDSAEFIRQNAKLIEKILGTEPHWILTSPSISEGINHLYATDQKTKELFTRAVGVQWSGDFGRTSRLWMRKEILSELRKL